MGDVITSTRRFAITGATGFIGRHLVAFLLQKGHDVIPLSRKPGLVSGINCKTIEGYKDEVRLRAEFQNCHTVVHLAALAHNTLHSQSSRDCDAFRGPISEVTESVARAARDAGVRRLVLISSIGVNGDRTQGRPFSERDSPAPVDPYAICKWDAEQRARHVLNTSSTELVVLRPPLVYGPGCPGNFKSLMEIVRRLPLIPFGALIKPRNFIFVGNLCDAIETAAMHPNVAGKTYLVSDATETSVADICRALTIHFGRGSWRVISVPVWLLKIVATLLRRASTFEKLANELTVDSTAFRLDTGWTDQFSIDYSINITSKG